MRRPEHHLFRMTVRTDYDPKTPEYRGSFSETFRVDQMQEWRVVAVDWSVLGEVTVTYLVPGSHAIPR